MAKELKGLRRNVEKLKDLVKGDRKLAERILKLELNDLKQKTKAKKLLKM